MSQTSPMALTPIPQQRPEKSFEDGPEQYRQSTLSLSSTLNLGTVRKPDLMLPKITFDPWKKKKRIILSLCILIFFDLFLPCALYYPLQYGSRMSNSAILGIACLSVGLGELAELPLRGYRLFRYPEKYAPLGQKSRWAFDSLFWYYILATIVAIIPYILATDLDEPIYWLFLLTPGILAVFCALPLIVTVYPFRLPFRISSDARGVPVKPAVYYVVEDFIAVDASQGRVFREEWRMRYNASPVMQRTVWELNIFWAFGCFVFTGALAGVTWGMSFSVAYGFSFALIFIWIGVWTFATWVWVRRAQRIELDGLGKQTPA